MSWVVTSIVGVVLAVIVIVGIVGHFVGKDVQGDLEVIDD